MVAKDAGFQNLVVELDFISFSHVRKKGNLVAHHLAKWASSLDADLVLLKDIPPCISSFVTADIAALN